MMMGFGFLAMLIVLAVPVLLVIGAIAWFLMRQIPQQNQPKPPTVGPPAVVRPTMAVPPATAPSAGRFCSHCGAGLQPEWTHCPQCGAPTG